MPKKPDFPLLDVAVTVIRQGQRLLAVYNPGWGSFTLPMTKQRSWHDPKVPKSQHVEAWQDAAARAGAEWLGRTCSPQLLLEDTGEFQQSDRDGQWKRYHFQVFQLALEGEPRLVPGAITEWLTPAEFLDRRPISPTARYLIAKLLEANLL